MPEAASTAAATGPTRHFLTFRLADRLYALPAGDVAEVIRIPAVAKMPQSPKALLGLSNLRGAILPLASGRGLLGQKGESDAVNGRAIVIHAGAPVAFTVDAVTELVEIPEGAMEKREAERAALPGEVLNGAFQPSGGGPIVKWLDVKSLLSVLFIARERPQRRLTRDAADTLADADVAQSASVKLASFAIAGQDYALPLEIVQEIVSAPALLASVPHSEALVLGITGFRDKLLPLLSLRGLLGFGPNPEPQKEKVVVATVRGNLVGLVVDEMRAIFSAEESRMDPIPDILAARTGGESRIASIYRSTDQRGLVSVLSPEQIFGDDVMQRLTDARKNVEAQAGVSQTRETRQYLVFRLGAEEYGLPIAAVEEVTRIPDKIARVPNTPKFLEGVINLRGEILPVVDQRKRFHMDAAPQDAARRIVVVRTERHIAGLIVDSVSEVLRASEEDIDVAPDLTGESTKLVMGVLNLDLQRRIVLLLDPAELLTRAEKGLLDKFAKQQDSSERPQA